jgi:hypothetical protein
VKESDSPTSPPNTSELQTGHELRTEVVSRNDLDRNGRVWPVKRTALPGKFMNGMNPEPDARRQSAQQQ